MPFPCAICPRKCGAPRDALTGSGFCGQGLTPRVARAAPHMWEEPPLSGERGSGAVFFAGCNLRCVYCQNYDLITASHFLDAVVESLTPPLPAPVVWNTSAYESVAALRRLEGRVQIYLPDMKYADPALAGKYSAAPDYPETAKAAILEMFRQTGPYELDENGLLRRGVLIRHLVLPNALDNTKRVIDWVSQAFRPGEVLFSLMSQYTPMGMAGAFPELNRRLTPEEYAQAMRYMENSPIEDGFYQELSSAKEEYTPDFDLTGVLP